jgi:hypothetical protein
MHSMTSLLRPLVALVGLAIAPTALADRGTSAPVAQPPTPSRAPQPTTQRPAAAPAGPSATRPPAAAPVVPAVQLAPIDVAALPEACKPLAKQALSPTLSVAFAGRMSLASCMAERAIAPLELCDCGESIVAIDKAAAPAIALLDEVIEKSDPATQALAEHAEGQLYNGFVTRLQATLPPLTAGATESEMALRDMRKQTLEAQLAPWREAAMASFQRVVDLVKEHPALANNRVVAAAHRDSQQRLAAAAATVATR